MTSPGGKAINIIEVKLTGWNTLWLKSRAKAEATGKSGKTRALQKASDMSPYKVVPQFLNAFSWCK